MGGTVLACSGECLFPRVVGAPTKGESMEVLVLRYVGAFWALLLTCFSSACPLVVNRPPEYAFYICSRVCIRPTVVAVHRRALL